MALQGGMAFGQQGGVYSDPVIVTQRDALAAAITHPEPVYTEIAKQLKLQGLVIISAFVDKEGKVVDTVVQLGNPLLVNMVEQALKQWRFKPFHDENGAVSAAKVAMQFDLKPPATRPVAAGTAQARVTP